MSMKHTMRQVSEAALLQRGRRKTNEARGTPFRMSTRVRHADARTRKTSLRRRDLLYICASAKAVESRDGNQVELTFRRLETYRRLSYAISSAR
jgi:hypothetical protein